MAQKALWLGGFCNTLATRKGKIKCAPGIEIGENNRLRTGVAQ
jgi:hypothetical protein